MYENKISEKDFFFVCFIVKDWGLFALERRQASDEQFAEIKYWKFWFLMINNFINLKKLFKKLLKLHKLKIK